jgi:uncharacterized protein (DUF58 family)
MIAAPLLPPEMAARLDRLSLVTRQRLLGSGQGERRSKRRGSSLEFADHRAYSPGDDPSRLDWNVYGRTGHLQVKVFEAEELLTVSIVLDGSASMRWGTPDKFRRASQIAATLGYLGLAGGNRVRLTVLHQGDPMRSRDFWSRRSTPALMRFLETQTADEPAVAHAEHVSNLLGLVQAGQRGAVGKSAAVGANLAILISDLLAETWQEVIRTLGSANSELIVLHVLDSAEVDPPLSGDLTLFDQETGAQVPVTLNAEVVAWYKARTERWLKDVAEFCTQRGARYARHITATPLEHLVFRELRVRGVLR